MGNLLRYLICIACVAVILLPIGILIHGSFQGGGIKNYVDILTKYHIETYFINSLIISVSVVVLVVVLDVLAGFALSKLNFPFKNGIYIFLLSALLLPAAAILVPVFQINSKLGILNTYLAVLGPYVVLIAPFNLLTIKNGFDALPNTVLEAALIGTSNDINVLKMELITEIRRQAVFLASTNHFFCFSNIDLIAIF